MKVMTGCWPGTNRLSTWPQEMWKVTLQLANGSNISKAVSRSGMSKWKTTRDCTRNMRKFAISQTHAIANLFNHLDSTDQRQPVAKQFAIDFIALDDGNVHCRNGWHQCKRGEYKKHRMQHFDLNFVFNKKEF